MAVWPEQRVQVAADKTDEKPQPEEPKHNGRHSREVVHRTANDAREQRGGMRVLRQISRRNHPDGNNKNRHKDPTSRGSENHRKDTRLVDVEHILFGARRNETPRNAGPSKNQDVREDDRQKRQNQERRQSGQTRKKERTIAKPRL